MSNERKRPDMRRLWQGQAIEGPHMSLEEIRNALAKLNRVERARTFGSGLLCLMFLVPLGGLLTVAPPIPVVRAAEWIFAISAAFFFFQAILGLRRGAGRLPTQGTPDACAGFYRSVLERQRKFYRRSAIWVPLLISACILPALPPVIPLAPAVKVVLIALWVVLVPFWIYTSMEVARGSQRELDRLNASSNFTEQ